MNEQELFEKIKMNIAINNLKNEYNNKHTLNEEKKWRGYMMKKKLVAITCGSIILITGGVLAYNKIVSSFGFGKGIDTAAENGYIANPEMDYVSSNTTATDQKTNISVDNINVNTKIEDFIMDDITIGTHFTFEIDTKINEIIDLDELQDIELKDLIVTDEEKRILYCMDQDAFEKYCKENNLSYKFSEFNENYYNCGLNAILKNHDKKTGIIQFTYNLYSGDKFFPKSKKLNFSFNEIQVTDKNTVVNINGNWNMSFDVPKDMYNRKSISYKVVSCENPDFEVTNATLTNTGFEFGLIISNMGLPEGIELINELEKKVVDGEIDINEYNRRINTEKELIEAREQYDKIKQPVTIYDWNNTPNNQNIENVTYVENETGEKFTSTMSPGRRQDANYIDGNKFSFYETFSLTTYTATNKLKVRVMFKGKPYVIELEKVN